MELLMRVLSQVLKAIFNFIVGDMRLLIGTGVALLVAALAARSAPLWTGPLFFLLLAVALGLALRREIRP
jgi:carbon starvation protein CstA